MYSDASEKFIDWVLTWPTVRQCSKNLRIKATVKMLRRVVGLVVPAIFANRPFFYIPFGFYRGTHKLTLKSSVRSSEILQVRYASCTTSSDDISIRFHHFCKLATRTIKNLSRNVGTHNGNSFDKNRTRFVTLCKQLVTLQSKLKYYFWGDEKY